MPSDFTVEVARTISKIPAHDWDQCAGGDNPFVCHAFLKALEDAGTVGGETGWLPYHICMRNPDGLLVAAAPCYAKGHSQGEYVFDHGWAQAFERAGGRYYPKLVVAVPFSPVPGPRLLFRPETNTPALQQAFASALIDVAKAAKVSSLHVNFCSEGEWRLLSEGGFLQRTGEQFHWENDGYKDFEAFLAALSSRKRKMIRKERRDANANGIEIHRLTGDEITPEHWEAFFDFYLDTGSRKWGRPYLNRAFFHELHEHLGGKVLLIMARRQGRWIAGALNLIGSDTLFGRNWGCIEYHPGLHFECCYYQAIDWAIERGLRRVEAGAQGEHKLARGYLPKPTYSAHWIAHQGFRDAVAEFLSAERREVANVIEYLSEHSPFRKVSAEEMQGRDEQE